MKAKNGKSKRLYLSLTLALLAGGVIFWASDLSSDPPMYYSGLGQSLSTDPAQYIHHARNKALFDEFDPFNYPRWTVYQHSLVSLIGYLWFQVFGVSSTQAGAVGLVMTFLSFIFLLLAVRRHHSNWVLAAIALCCVINVTMLTYGRLTYLEIGLMLITSVIFWVYARWGTTRWSLVICGTLAAAAMLTGKLFGALLLPCLILVTLLSFSNRKFLECMIMSVSFAVTGILLVLILYGSNISTAASYIMEQSYGLRGFPEGLSSPWGFVEHFISYGFKNRLFYLDPDILVFTVSILILTALYRSSGIHFRDFSPVARLTALWVLITFVGLMPLNYSPVRYAVIMLPAVIAGFFTICDHWRSRNILSKFKFDRRGKMLIGLAFWMLGYHLIMNAFFFNTFPSPTPTVVWAVFPVAILLTMGAIRLIEQKPELLSARNMKVLLFLILAASVTANGFRIRRMYFLEHNYNLAEANRDLNQILSKGAVVSGPYGPALTIDNNVRSFVHLFGVAKVDSTLFDRYPITHLAVDSSNWSQAVKDYPQLAGLKPITSYWIRDYEVALYNISKSFSNAEANSYLESDYERALAAFYRLQPDSAELEIKRFLAENPESKSGIIILIDILSAKQQFAQVRDLLSSLADKYPTDFFLQLQAGRLYQILAYHNKDQGLLSLSRHYYERGVKVNRYKADMANSMFSQSMQQIQAADQKSP